MNWRKIDDNWKSFVEDYNLKEESGENNYFYGKQELYRASEDFQGFYIHYENKFNKSAELGSSFRIGHRLTFVSPIELDQNWNLTMEKKSLWTRIFNSSEKLKIECSDKLVINLLPIDEIEFVTSFFPDLKLSVKKFDKFQNQYITYGQNVLMIETKYQPEEFEHLKKTREVMILILEKLKMNKKIKPAHNTVYSK
ncbi:hypothetical protein [Echinicola vietnamensis]|uniref:DUF3137 domain-containing protein n=1 Tax=Echinicola vietnamensis (strain DSM 17526 / LMG 23754 / KMM 6221) TaxID=926556 RepID=L0G2G3_ECHVK|nr:hypothetical protein [Echinicola vietnamensis]AGA79493.1 hypothetical protein Echvi_3268 [Echinicola vietnamensis DSM 17526]